MTDAFMLSRDILITSCDRDGLRYEKLDEGLFGGTLTTGSVYVDLDGDHAVMVLVVDPVQTQTRPLEAAEVVAWRQRSDDLPVWDETDTYRWEYAPGPWLGDISDSGEIAVVHSR